MCILFRLVSFTERYKLTFPPCLFYDMVIAHLFLALNNMYYLNVPKFIYLFMYWRPSWLPLSLAILDQATINICMQVFVWTEVLNSFR